MAYEKNKGKEKAPEKEKGNKPDWSVRARQSPGSDFFLTIAVGWNIDVAGKPAISLKFNSLPVGWDGSCLVMSPKEES